MIYHARSDFIALWPVVRKSQSFVQFKIETVQRRLKILTVGSPNSVTNIVATVYEIWIDIFRNFNSKYGTVILETSLKIVRRLTEVLLLTTYPYVCKYTSKQITKCLMKDGVSIFFYRLYQYKPLVFGIRIYSIILVYRYFELF